MTGRGRPAVDDVGMDWPNSFGLAVYASYSMDIARINGRTLGVHILTRGCFGGQDYVAKLKAVNIEGENVRPQAAPKVLRRALRKRRSPQVHRASGTAACERRARESCRT
ncbi:uncharacterized protein LOC144101219 [Amblyomma americanum]